MGQYGAAQGLVDTMRSLEKKYNPAEWLNRSSKKDDNQYRMNWKPEPNAEQRQQIERQHPKPAASRSTAARKPAPKRSAARKPVRKASR